MASLCHPWFTTTSLSYRFPIFETSATALCGTTGIIIYDYIILYMQYIPWVSHHMELYPHSGWFIPHSSTKTLGYSTMLWWYTILNMLKYTPIGSCRILYILGTWTNLRYREAHPPGPWYARICDGKPQLWDEEMGKWQQTGSKLLDVLVKAHGYNLTLWLFNIAMENHHF